MLRRVLLLAGVCCLLALPFVGQTWYGSVRTHHIQQSLERQLAAPGAPRPTTAAPAPSATTSRSSVRQRVAAPVAAPAAPGRPIGTIRVPRFGDDWSWVVVEGTAEADLDKGPGHYTGSPTFGDLGNVAVAAHRAGHGSPFLDFDTLRAGDRVVVQQQHVTWTYAITQEPRIIEIADSWVLDPLPGRMLTLTTCWPKYGSSKRMYAVATLVGTDTGRMARG